MYNTYTYDLSKDKPNMNLNIAEFFEEIEPIDINKILDEINANLIKSIQESAPEEPAPKKPDPEEDVLDIHVDKAPPFKVIVLDAV